MTDDDLTEVVDAIRDAIGTNDEPKIKACIRCRFHAKSPATLIAVGFVIGLIGGLLPFAIIDLVNLLQGGSQ